MFPLIFTCSKQDKYNASANKQILLPPDTETDPSAARKSSCKILKDCKCLLHTFASTPAFSLMLTCSPTAYCHFSC